MTSRILRVVSWLTLRHPVPLLVVVSVLTVALYVNIRNLRMGASITDLFGEGTPELRAANQYVERSGYGNQLFLMIEATGGADPSPESMEALAERITAGMNRSGYFKYARCGFSEKELLSVVRMFAWNFPSFVQPGQLDQLKVRLSEEGVRNTVNRAATGLITPFSWLGANYFVTDPLAVMEVIGPSAQSLNSMVNFDLEWGGGNYFYSKDHKALLVIAEPTRPVMDYKFSLEVVNWARDLGRSLLAQDEFQQAPLYITLAGGYVYAEQDRKFIEQNIRVVSWVSILGTLALCLLVYRRIPLLLLSFVPTTLGLLWTTGLVSAYPGEVNLISLSFIAILVGLGDDQVVYFMNRVPQEWTEGKSLEDAMAATIATTGKSILFCLLTTGTATAALMLARFKALSEFGLVLTIGLLMLLLHTLLTIPALMRLWWKHFPPRAAGRVTTFRFLPAISRPLAGMVAAHPRLILAVSIAVFGLATVSLPFLRISRQVEIHRGDEHAGIVGQRRLAERFGIEGTPELILLQGAEDDVLRRAEGLTAELELLRKQGRLKSVFSPSQIVPSRQTQRERGLAVARLDLTAAARSLERHLKASGFNLPYFQPAIARLRELGGEPPQPLTLEEAGACLPRGLLDNSVQKLGGNRYLAAIAVYADPDVIDAIPVAAIRNLQRKYGPFVDFSYPKISRDLQGQIFQDSRRALLLTTLGIVLIVYFCFRSVRIAALALTPLVFGVAVTFGLLVLAGHPFTFMALTAIPLIIGIGIDNTIHLTRRYLEGGSDISGVLRLAGAPLLQSNLTTIIGFGALMASQFEPLAELGLVTALGVAMTLIGSFWVLPAIVAVSGVGCRGGQGTAPDALQED